MESPVEKKESFSFRRIQFDWRKFTVAEPILFFLFASFGFRMLSSQQILQDKVCVGGHGLSVEYCRDFSHQRGDDIKQAVLQDYQVISTYRTLLQFLISNLCPLYLFIGGFCDAYPNGRRVALLGIILDGLLQTVVVIMNNIKMSWSPWVFIITGLSPIHDYTAITIINSYIIVNTKPEERVKRMMFISVIFLLGLANGLFFTGIILNTRMEWVQKLAPWQIHNTMLPLMIGLFFQFCAFMWTYIFVVEQPIQRNTDDNQNDTTTDENSKNEKAKEKSILRKIFDVQLIKDSFQSVFKDRPYNMRFNLYMVIAIQVLITFTQIGPMNNMLPVMQLLYKWDPSVFSMYSTVSMLWKPIALIIITPLVTKLFKRSDLQIAFFGTVGIFLSQVAIGSIVRPAGYFLNHFLDSASICASTGLRSYLSKKIPEVEITKIFFALQLVESLIPPAGSIFYTAIVSYSQSFYPTLIFHVSASIVLIALIITAYLDIATIPIEALREREEGREMKEREKESEGPSSPGKSSAGRDHSAHSAPLAHQDKPKKYESVETNVSIAAVVKNDS